MQGGRGNQWGRGGGGRGNYYKEKYGNKRGGGGGGGGRDYHGHGNEDRHHGGSLHDLRHRLLELDGQSYGRYHEVKGVWTEGSVTVLVDRVQSDPFAGPSNVRLRVSQQMAQFPPDLFQSRVRRVALCDYLNRHLWGFLKQRRYDLHRGGSWASEKGGEIVLLEPCQQVLETSAVVVSDEFVELRLLVGLPGAGRSISGRFASQILCEHLPETARLGMLASNYDPAQMRFHVDAVEDQQALRAQLPALGLIAFVADGAILPRAAGDSDEPMDASKAVRFESPTSLRVTIAGLPHRGTITGMGIARGVTLIVGGGFHGKSTLLRVIQNGIFDHVPGDGREFCVTIDEAVKVRSCDGRSVCQVNIHPFIAHLPFGAKETTSFSSENASGSTSQASSISEAIEVGAQALLIDEDTSATNFMIRDARMAMLVAKQDEPITPFIQRIRQLAAMGVSTVAVIGGAGDYLCVADRVVQMREYRCLDVTARAAEIVQATNAVSLSESGPLGDLRSHRVPDFRSFSALVGGKTKIKAPQAKLLLLGEQEINLADCEQIPDRHVTYAIGWCLHAMAETLVNKGLTVGQAASLLDSRITAEELDVLDARGFPPAELKRPRRIDIAQALNRIRTLRMNK